jgi:hypothetical protein
MADIREVVEGMQYQGGDEIISYTVDTANWGGTPTSVVVAVKESTLNGANVTTTVMPTNTPSVATDVITLSPLKLLTAGYTYKVEVQFVANSNTVECFFLVKASE